MLRDGPFISENNLRMKVWGVFVPASGLLHAVAEPKMLALPFSAAEANPASPSYRCHRNSSCPC